MESKVLRDILRDKHPPGRPAHQDSLSREALPYIHPVVFDYIDKNIVKSAALEAHQGLMPTTGEDYAPASDLLSADLCQALAEVAKRHCTTYVDPKSIAPFVACRLIALDKNPGVRPIGIATQQE